MAGIEESIKPVKICRPANKHAFSLVLTLLLRRIREGARAREEGKGEIEGLAKEEGVL